MKCEFLMATDKQIKAVLDFFQSQGMGYLNEKKLIACTEREGVDIDFYSIPEVLEIYATDNIPSIWHISNLGITFYAPLSPHSSVKAKCGRVDGYIFCPMTNVRCISTFEELYIE